MYRNIDRRKTHFHDTSNILVGHIRESYIITVNKRQTRIVVLKIERFTQALRILVYEAENATVLA
jgi:hypothetical protein